MSINWKAVAVLGVLAGAFLFVRKANAGEVTAPGGGYAGSGSSAGNPFSGLLSSLVGNTSVPKAYSQQAAPAEPVSSSSVASVSTASTTSTATAPQPYTGGYITPAYVPATEPWRAPNLVTSWDQMNGAGA